MSIDYYTLIRKRLKNLATENQIGEISIDDILDDPQLNTLIHSIAYVADNINKQIQESKSQIYNLIISKIYNFLFQIKASNILISFTQQNDNKVIHIPINTQIQINTPEYKYIYTVLSNYSFLPIEILESKYIRYDQVSTNNYLGNYFLEINIKINGTIQQLENQIVRLFVDHNNYNQILLNIITQNTPVYIYQNNITTKAGSIKIDAYYNLQADIKIVPKYFDYIYQNLTNNKLFAFLNIHLKSLKFLNKNTNYITILIPSKQQYDIKNIIKYNIFSAYNYNKKTTNSFKMDSGFDKTIHLNYEENYNESISKVINIVSINKISKHKQIYLPEYSEFNIILGYLVNKNITWDYKNFIHNDQYFTKVMFIPQIPIENLNLQEEIFYATVYYTQIIKYLFICKNIITNIKNIQDLCLVSQPTSTVINEENQSTIDDLLSISKLNINDTRIFQTQIKCMLNTLFKAFKITTRTEYIIENIQITNETYTKYYVITIILKETYVPQIGLLISIIYFINHYFDISYKFKYRFIKLANKETIL